MDAWNHYLDKDPHVGEILAAPPVEWVQQLKAV
jgi:hypothetical protein